MDINKIASITPLPVLNQIPSVIQQFQINNPIRLAHFLGQCSEESMGFSKKIENLNYSADGLLKTFPTHFTTELAQQYQHKPEMIANRVYANRYGNGDEASGDGFKFRGRGAIEITFKDNYAEFDKAVPENILDNPNLVCDKYFLFSAGWFWSKHNLNEIADEGISDLIITKETKVINGGVNGLLARIQKIENYYNLLKNN